jgi:hypothetical protein
MVSVCMPGVRMDAAGLFPGSFVVLDGDVESSTTLLVYRITTVLRFAVVWLHSPHTIFKRLT